MSAKRIVEHLGGGRRAWLCRCRCPHKTPGVLNLIVMNTARGVSTHCLLADCDQRDLPRVLLDLGVTPDNPQEWS
jgi:hypothetical protein